MSSYCCSSSDFLHSNHTVLLSSFLLPFSCTSWCCRSLPCISQILQVQIVSFSVLSFCHTDQEFLQYPRVFSSDDVCQESHWLFQSLLLSRWWSLNPRSVSSLFMMVKGANSPLIIAWKVSNTLGYFSPWWHRWLSRRGRRTAKISWASQ